MVKERKIKNYMYFIIFDEFVEQQIFLTKIVFFAIFASNPVLAENRAKMP